MKKTYKKKDDDKPPYAQVVAERIIEALENGTAPWMKTWKPGRPNASLPFNPTTQQHYKGINNLWLLMAGFSDPRWMTFKQAQALGANVRKGEKGTTIQYWSFQKTSNKTDDSGNPIKGDDGRAEKETVNFHRPRVFSATVFNAAQIDGLEPLYIPDEPEEGWDGIERADQIFEASGAKIIHLNGDKAFYSPSRDSITMPERHQFADAASYYAVKLHELGHWTGHPSRLARDLSGSFGSESYAKEELRAEIASLMIGDALGLGHDPGNHVAYVQSWIKALRQDPLEIFRAASAAEKIKSYILAFEPGQVLEKGADQPEDHFGPEP